MTPSTPHRYLARWLLPLWVALSGIANAAPQTTLVVADQNEVTRVLLQASDQQKNLPFNLQFADFSGGPAILEAFRADAVDVGVAGSTPPIQAHAAGEDLPIIAALVSDHPAYELALASGVSVTQLSDLKGKRIAYAEGTARQTFVLAALRQAGLTTHDVQLVPLRVSDFVDAISTKQVDVAPLIEPHFSRYIGQSADRQQRFVPAQQLERLPRDILYLYASAKALADPAKHQALQALANSWLEAHRWAQTNKEQWAKVYYVEHQQLPEADALRIVNSQGKLRTPALKDMIATQQNIIDLIDAAGELPRPLKAEQEFALDFQPAPLSISAPEKGATDEQ